MDYTDLKKSELVELAEERGIDSSGTKTDIIDRLEGDDATVDADNDAADEHADLPLLDEVDPESSSLDVPAPAPAPAESVPAPVATSDDPSPVARESGAWNKLGRDIYDTFKDEAKELWGGGKEDRAWLLSVAQRIAKQKYLATRAESNSAKNAHETNLKHLYVQIEGETARKKMVFVSGGDEIFLKIVKTTIKMLSGPLIAAVL